MLIESLLSEYISSNIERREQIEEELKKHLGESLVLIKMELYEDENNLGSINVVLQFNIPSDGYNVIDFKKLFGNLNVFAMFVNKTIFGLMVQVGEYKKYDNNVG